MIIGFVLCDTCTKEQLAERLITIVSCGNCNEHRPFDGVITLGKNIVVDPTDVPFSIITDDNKLHITNAQDILHYTFSLKSEPHVKILPRISKLDIVSCIELPCQVNEIIAASRSVGWYGQCLGQGLDTGPLKLLL